LRSLALILVAVVVSACGGGISTRLCGGPRQPCCDGSKCNEGAVCDGTSVCVACGGEGQACCESGCGAGLACTSGACVTAVSCDTPCTLSTQRCTNNGIETCSAGGACPAWKTTLAVCPAGLSCQGDGTTAECVEVCPGACVIDSLLCTTVGLKRCVSQGPCPSLLVEQDNSQRPTCLAGAVIEPELSWESPTPAYTSWVDIAGTLLDSYWLLDDAGNIVHYALGPWEYEVRPVAGRRMRHLADCNLGSTLYAAGENGFVQRRSGGVWTEETAGSSTFVDIVCDSSGPWALSADGKLWTRRSGAWVGAPVGVAGPWRAVTSLFSQQQLFVVGDGGRVARCDISSGTPACVSEPNTSTADLTRAWADTYSGLVFASGPKVLVQRAGMWGPIPTPGVQGDFVDVTGVPITTGVAEPWVVALTDRGELVTRRGTTIFGVTTLPSSDFSAVWAPDENNVLATTLLGELWFRDGVPGSVTTQRAGHRPMTADLTAVTSVGDGRLFAVGLGGARYRRQNDTWSLDTVGEATTVDLLSITGKSIAELYAVGGGGTVLARRYGTWSREAAGLTTEDLNAVVMDTRRVWAAGAGVLLEKDRATGAWTSLPLPEPRQPIFGLAMRTDASGKALEVVLAGGGCTLLSFNPETRAFTPGPACPNGSGDFSGATFLPTGELVAVTFARTALRRAGNTLVPEVVNSGTVFDPFYAVFTDGTTAWAVGEGGALFRRSSQVWSPTALDVTPSAFFGGVSDEAGTFFVGSSGTVLRRR